MEEAIITQQNDKPLSIIYKGRALIINLERLLHQKSSGAISLRHGLVIGCLAFFIIITNIIDSRSFAEQNFIDINPTQAKQIVDAVSIYTPIIQEDSSRVVSAAGTENISFLERPALADSIKNPTIYSVQKGDTISSIARKYSLTVATILDSNNLKSTDANSIKPGSTLTIPTYNTSSSSAWIDEINKEKADAAAKAAADNKKKQLALGSSRTLPFRDSSTTRSKATADYSGYSGGSFGFIIPISYSRIARGVGGGHTGVDYDADIGTPVSAAKDGKIIEITSGWAGGWGNSVVIDHGGGLTTRYAHLSKVAISIGESVSQGNIIGYSGNSGFSTGPHMHFQAELNGRVTLPFAEGSNTIPIGQ